MTGVFIVDGVTDREKPSYSYSPTVMTNSKTFLFPVAFSYGEIRMRRLRFYSGLPGD